jgi:opacity protein-like surface antigen
LKLTALVVSVFSMALAGSVNAADVPVPVLGPEIIVQNYCAATQQALGGRAASMEMEIHASLPGQKKQGRFHALRKINPFGRITYARTEFEGDNAVKSQVVERYLQAEAEAQQDDEAASVAVTPANYKFQYKGQKTEDGRAVHVFQLTPLHKRKGLFKGDVWIDAETFLPVRESGKLIKSPSIFVKRVAFVRTFDIRDGLSIPLQVQSVVDTVFGSAELTVDFSNFSLDDSDGDGETTQR